MQKGIKVMFWGCIGGVSGLLLAQITNPAALQTTQLGVMIAGAIIGGLLYRFGLTTIAKGVKNLSSQDLVIRGLGFLFGLLMVALLAVIMKPFIEVLPLSTSVGLILLSGILITGGTTVFASLKGKELSMLFFGYTNPAGVKPAPMKNQLKIVDTSAIIDGRIADLCQTGFLEGVLIIPNFVLAELQKIADSPDPLKRNRGRRGLDLLNKMQKENLVTIRIFDRDYDELTEVDTKLLRLARELEAKVITNDFNLNKVAELYGVQVLNINELSNAIKPVVLPGEEMAVRVLRDGKEYGQGIGYLEDGTMIVVEGGRNYIGLDIEILVTSVLQTSAGRMIFAKPKECMSKAISQQLG